MVLTLHKKNQDLDDLKEKTNVGQEEAKNQTRTTMIIGGGNPNLSPDAGKPLK